MLSFRAATMRGPLPRVVIPRASAAEERGICSPSAPRKAGVVISDGGSSHRLLFCRHGQSEEPARRLCLSSRARLQLVCHHVDFVREGSAPSSLGAGVGTPYCRPLLATKWGSVQSKPFVFACNSNLDTRYCSWSPSPAQLRVSG